MSHKVGYWSDLSNLTLSEDHKSWIHAASFGQFKHPLYGVIDFTREKLQRFADSVKNRVRGIDPDVDYDHKEDPTKGFQAAGWVKDAEVRSDGLWLFVEWTASAAQAIKDKAYKYFSPEFDDTWVDQHGNTHTDVLFGGGLTNRPFLKDLLPVNLSELVFNTPPVVPPVPPTNKETDVDVAKLAELLGLPAGSDEEAVKKCLSELRQPPTPPNPTPPTPPTPAFQLSEEMRKLAEANPAFKLVLDHMQALAEENKTNKTQLREQLLATKMSEFDRAGGKLALSPRAKDLIGDVHLELSEAGQTKFWELLNDLRAGHASFVELGERGGSIGNYSRDKAASVRFNELVEKTMTDDKLAYPDAVERVAALNPQLYKEYRDESYIAKV